MTVKTKIAVLVAVCISAAAIACNARVFWRWNSASESTKTVESFGGVSAYRADVSLNGGKGVLTVFSISRPLADIVGDLVRAFNMQNAAPRTDSMWMGDVASGDAVIKFMALRLGAEDKTVLIQLEQSLADSRTAAQRPDRHLLDAVPSFPDSEPLFFASDANAGMSMEVSGTGADDQSVAGYFDSSLRAAGWSVPLESKVSDKAPAMQVFVRKQDICCVLTDVPAGGGQTRITILHKQRGMK